MFKPTVADYRVGVKFIKGNFRTLLSGLQGEIGHNVPVRHLLVVDGRARGGGCHAVCQVP